MSWELIGSLRAKWELPEKAYRQTCCHKDAWIEIFQQSKATIEFHEGISNECCEEGSDRDIVLWTNGKIGSFSSPTGVVWSRARLRRRERSRSRRIWSTLVQSSLKSVYVGRSFSPTCVKVFPFLLTAVTWPRKLIHFLKAEIQMNNTLKGGASYCYSHIFFAINQYFGTLITAILVHFTGQKTF